MHEAKPDLSKLVEAAEEGEQVMIARGDNPAVRLVPVTKSGFKFGTKAHILTGPIPDFQEPM